ncbi:hypothetical protein DSO57_1018035 [Entomophthora muscae]|uniref:Uncharacterized protein n=1 Tax=Entomophthora muscae TaxID=34485 RepID=A0ACC2UPX0_9FUNG|nr:hypothetical protein DSO57_1018035 [Entomophthora muscae]
MEANNQASMGLCRSNNALPQSCPAPGSAHNQVGHCQSQGNCGKFDSLVIDSLVLKTLSSTRELSATYLKSLPPLALDRTIFLRHTKKLAQKPAKPLNSLEDLAHTIDERFVLAYPSQEVIDGALDSVPTWEEYLINLDYLLAWA